MKPATTSVAALAVLAALLSGSGTTADADTQASWRVNPSPFVISFLSHGRTVTSEAGGTTAGPGGRLSYQADGTYHRLTDLTGERAVPGGTAYSVATDEPGRTATVTVTRTSEGVRLAWTLTPSTGVTEVFESLTAGPAEHYLGGSSAAYVDLRGRIRGWSPGKEGSEAGDYCQDQEQSASPFYLSSGGYGLYAEGSDIGRFAFPGATPVADGPTCARTPSVPTGDPVPAPCPVSASALPDRVQVCVFSDRLSYDVFFGSPAQVTTGYYRVTGLPSLPPRGEFGLMKWRDVSADQAQVLADVAEFRRLGIPLGTIWIDNPWEQQPPGNTGRMNGSACVGSLRFDPTFFPDPAQMIAAVHAAGVKFGLWVGPQVSSPRASQGGGSCAGLNSVWSANGWLIPGTNYIDFSNPAARAYYTAQLTRLFSTGVDMAKEDRGEEFRLQTAQLSGGSGASLYLEYPDLYHAAVTDALRAVDGNAFETLVRSGVPGTAAVAHGMWGSDTFATFSGLQAELRYGISESLTGDFAWGSDTGGIDPQPPATVADAPTPVLFDRWAQFSAVSPVFEVGGAGLNATPWEYPSWAVDDFRSSVILHYELFPYLYGLAVQAARTGVPILRAVGYQYPSDQAAWAAGDQEFMVGPDLLAAPVTASRAEADGVAGRPTPVSVYLPAGRWVNVFTGQVVPGGQTVVDSAGLDEFPLFLRTGTAIGFNARTPDVWSGGWGTNDLAKPGLAGWLYAPGASGRVVLHGAPPHAQVLVLMSHPPRSVSVDGRVLPRAADAAALRGMDSGWVFSPGAFGGVTVKVSAASSTLIVQVSS
jgi:alpha-glucosidase (family GH31 glycosyl hydrolase)